MAPSIATIAIHTLNIIIGILSVAILALVIHSVILTDSSANSLPDYVKEIPRSFLFWPGCGGIVDALLFAFLWYMTPSVNDGKARKRRGCFNGLLFVASFIFGRPLIVLIYTFVEYNGANKDGSNPTASWYTPETWACARRGDGAPASTGELCADLKAARWLLVPEVILGGIMLVLVNWMRINVGKGRIAMPMRRNTDGEVVEKA